MEQVDWMNGERARQIRFFVIAVVAYLVYGGTYSLMRRSFPLVTPSFLFLLAILLGDSVNYLGSRYWVFKQSTVAVVRQGAVFFLGMFLTLSIQSLLFWIGRRWSIVPEPILVLVLPGVRIILNYLFHRFVTFTSPPSL